MDFNGDGKHDWKDYADLHNINNMANEESSFGHSSNKKDSFKFSPLSKLVVGLTVGICIFALLSGAVEVAGTVLQFGVIAFFITQWLSS